MAVNLKSLIGKLNDTTRNTVESAAGLCLSRTHYAIEIEHYLLKLLDAGGSDFLPILRRFEIDKSRLSAELTRSLDKLKSGNARTPSLSPSLVEMMKEAWVVGSIDQGAGKIRSGFTILALVSNQELARQIHESSRELQKIDAGTLHKEFDAITAGSVEETAAPGAEAAADSPRAAKGGKTPNLDQFTVDLTEKARKGGIDPVLGRDFEIRQLVDILLRRRQNNPILTGEAGVGKTAVVEGFALRVAQGDVPAPLKNVSIRALDLALLQAGAGIKGEFENRLKGLIEEVKSSPAPIIVFIDEAHTMIGAGGQAGQGDAANLLKPALARGELRTIAATTWSEYKKYFEKDPALARRFQVVKVEEPTEDQCLVMLRGVVSILEKHHNVRILDEGVENAVHLSHRYLAERQLPDKAVSVLDTACSRLSLSQEATPPAIEDVTRQLDAVEVEERVLSRESAVGTDHAERLAELAARKAELQTRLESLQGKWSQIRELVLKIRDLRMKIENSVAAGAAAAGAPAADGGGVSDTTVRREELSKLQSELDQVQGEDPLMRVCVDGQLVGEVISGWTGIPVGKLLKDEIAMVLELESHLGRRLIGQDYALQLIAERIRTSRSSLDDPGKPVGVFMLVGPSGVGKTETALSLADLLYGGERNLITINMSEFQEAHTVSTLKGSPPGYVGYGEGGVLTEAVRRRPYSVVLLDEVEKAHPDVLELFYQVFDKGLMEDGEGREINFKNTIILLTTNACTDQIAKLTADPETAPTPEGLIKAIKPELNKIFKPAFLGRMVIIPYYPVRDEVLKQIVRLKLGKIRRRLRENHRIDLVHDEALIQEVADRCTEVESGARNIDNILTNTLLPDISRRILSGMAEGRTLESIRVSIGANSQFVYD